jgi:hypothetical protein
MQQQQQQQQQQQHRCECGFASDRSFNVDRHRKSKQHIKKMNLLCQPSNLGFFVCDSCDYATDRKHNFQQHLLSNKHSTTTTTTTTTSKDVNEVVEILMKHQTDMMKSQQIQQTEMFKQQTEMFKAVLLDRGTNVMMLPAAQNNITLEQTNCQNTTNSNNKKFSLNVFLNEECKNAVDISEFITNAMITMEDLELMGEVGYTEGMTRILSKAFKEKSTTERPMHCTDVKRETIYVRKNDAWEKDVDQEETKRLIQKIAHKNYKVLTEWRDHHPQYSVHDTPDYESWYSISRSICNTDPSALKKLVKHLAMTTAVEKDL